MSSLTCVPPRPDYDPALAIAYVRWLEENPTRDDTYKQLPLGHAVSEFLAYFRSDFGATDSSYRDYESVLARFVIHLGHLELTDLDVPHGTPVIRRALDEVWGERAPRTRKKVRAIIVSLLDYHAGEGHLVANAARPIRSPRQRGVERGVFDPAERTLLIENQARARDRLALRLLFALGLRKSELTALRLRHFDFARRRLTVFGKGGTVHRVPVHPDVLQEVERYALGRDPDEFLLFPEKRGPRIPRGPVEVLWEDRLAPMSATAAHRWWHARLAAAGITGRTMHEARHTAITDFLRASGNLKLTQQFARHASIQTTADVYAHLDDADLEAAILLMYSDRDA